MWIERVVKTKTEWESHIVNIPEELYSTGKVRRKAHEVKRSEPHTTVSYIRYYLHFGKKEYEDDSGIYPDFATYKEACEFMRYLYGGEETESVKRYFQERFEADKREFNKPVLKRI